MSPGFRKFLLVLGALVIAAAITCYPWTYVGHFTGAAEAVYFMSSMIWAPAALISGIASGVLFAFALWPRKPKSDAAGTPDGDRRRGPYSIDA